MSFGPPPSLSRYRLDQDRRLASGRSGRATATSHKVSLRHPPVSPLTWEGSTSTLAMLLTLSPD